MSSGEDKRKENRTTLRGGDVEANSLEEQGIALSLKGVRHILVNIREDSYRIPNTLSHGGWEAWIMFRKIKVVQGTNENT